MDIIEIWTDGSCLNNPGVGGWGAILKFKGKEKEISGNTTNTTNNKMELTAAIKALRELKKHPLNIHIYTDSKYVVEGITKWIFGWKKKKWKDVKNRDLWEQLDLEANKHRIKWEWVKAHNGNEYNERCDTLARKSAELLKNSS